MLAEIAPPGKVGAVMAWAYGIEGSGSAILGAPVVAALAQHVFGYMPARMADLSDISMEQARPARAIVVRQCVSGGPDGAWLWE